MLELLSEEQYTKLLKFHSDNFKEKNTNWVHGNSTLTKGIHFTAYSRPSVIKKELNGLFSEVVKIKSVHNNGKGVGVDLTFNGKDYYVSESFYSTVENKTDAKNMMFFSLVSQIKSITK